MFIQGAPYRHHLDVLHHLFISLCGEVRTTSESGYQHWQISLASSPLDLHLVQPPIHWSTQNSSAESCESCERGAARCQMIQIGAWCYLVPQRLNALMRAMSGEGSTGRCHIFTWECVTREAWDRWDWGRCQAKHQRDACPSHLVPAPWTWNIWQGDEVQQDPAWPRMTGWPRYSGHWELDELEELGAVHFFVLQMRFPRNFRCPKVQPYTQWNNL